MRNWQVEDDVTVVYPNGTVKNGTIARCKSEGKYCVLFEDSADPNVWERWLRVPGEPDENSLAA